MAAALRKANVANTLESRPLDRQAVRDALAALDRPEKAIPGVSAPLYFDEHNSLPQPVRVGEFRKGQLISAPFQLAPVTNLAVIDVDKELAAGKLVRLGKQLAWKQRVVYTGIDFNQLIQLDQTRGSFTADFYLWFRYAGDDEVIEIDFPNAVEKGYDAKSPLVAKTVDGLNYRLYRVRGEFKNPFDFVHYPFDRQSLVLRLLNNRLSRDQVVYAVDTFGLRLPRPASVGGEGFKSSTQWSFGGIHYFQEALTSQSTRGDPGAFATGTETEFSGFNAVAVLQRRTASFLLKMLLPLLLLVFVVYVSLHFPEKMNNDRVTMSITALLASAVFLSGINAQLTEATYATAIEYGFYIFFGLCLFCITVALGLDRLRNVQWNDMAHRLEVLSRVVYILVVLGTVGAYVFLYGFRQT